MDRPHSGRESAVSRSLATLDFFSDAGEAQAVAIGGTQRTTYSAPLAARSVLRVVTDGLRSDIAPGWARLTAPIDGIRREAIIQSTAGGNIASEAGVHASPAASHLVTYFDYLGWTASWVAVCSPGNTTVNVTWSLRDVSGQVRSTATRPVPPLGHMTWAFAGLFQVGIEGTMEIFATGGPVAVTALRFGNPGFSIFSAIPVVALR